MGMFSTIGRRDRGFFFSFLFLECNGRGDVRRLATIEDIRGFAKLFGPGSGVGIDGRSEISENGGPFYALLFISGLSPLPGPARHIRKRKGFWNSIATPLFLFL